MKDRVPDRRSFMNALPVKLQNEIYVTAAAVVSFLLVVVIKVSL